MIGIVIVAHAGLAEAFAEAVQHVVGPLPHLAVVSVDSDDGPSARRSEICAAAVEVDQGDGVVLVTDLFGSTPSNLAINACQIEGRMDVLYGANLPMLIQLAKSRSKPRAEAVASALDAGRRYTNVWRAPVVEAI
ncbi:MAG: PTS fructose transporter subunit IIA [Pseudomonadota bacterium]